jgi:hypothetical protein
MVNSCGVPSAQTALYFYHALLANSLLLRHQYEKIRKVSIVMDAPCLIATLH